MPTPSASSPPPGPDTASGDDLRIIDPLCAVFRRQLKSAGLKYTPERAYVLDTVMCQPGLFQADHVLADAKSHGKRYSKATVYRTLRLLQDAGIIQRVPFDDEHAHYQVVYGRESRDVLIRLDTRDLIEIDVPGLAAQRDALCAKMGLTARGHRLQIFAERAR